MSSRVQKGNTVFRPVAKPRPRAGTETRQLSATPAPQSRSVSVLRDSQPPETVAPSASVSRPMGPSSIIPSKPRPPSSIVAEPRREESVSLQASISSQRIIVPSRDSRPPAVSIPTTQRTASASRPPAITTTAPVPVATPTPRSQPPPPITADIPESGRVTDNIPPATVTSFPTTRPEPTPVEIGPAIPSAQPSVSALAPPAPVPQPDSNIDHAQIDPALLQAVVAALRSAERSQTQQTIPSNHAEAPTAGPSIAPPPEEPTETTVPARKLRGRKPKTTTATNGEVAAETSSRPRRKRSKQTEIDENNVQRNAEGEASISTNGKRPTKRRRTTSGVGRRPEAEGSGEEDESATGKQGRRRRKSTAPASAPFDPNADPGEEIDPTAVTMAALCDDPGTGRISSKAAQIVSSHATWRAANKAKRERMRAIMEAKKYGRNLEEEEEREAIRAKEGSLPPEKPSGAVTPALEVTADAGPSTIIEDLGLDKGHDFDYSQRMRTSRYAAQVRIGPNGEMIVDEESLFVERQEGEEDTAGYTLVEESDISKFVNSGTYSKKARGSRWSAEETELFFDALSQFGENYELISYVLPGRDRKACKNKFKAEDRKDPARVNYCLTHCKPVDMQTLSRMTGKDFSGPTPEIRAPTPVRLGIIPSAEQEAAGPSAQVKESTTPVADAVEEVIGTISDMEDEELPERPILLR